MITQTIQVDGMSCDHCVETIQKAVKELSGIDAVHIDLEKKQVTVTYDADGATLEEIAQAITESGFEVVNS